MSLYLFVLFESAVRSAAAGVNYTLAVKTGESTLLQHSWPSDDDKPNDVVVSDKNGVIFNVATGMCIVFVIASFVVCVYLLVNTDISLVLLPKKNIM